MSALVFMYQYVCKIYLQGLWKVSKKVKSLKKRVLQIK